MDQNRPKTPTEIALLVQKRWLESGIDHESAKDLAEEAYERANWTLKRRGSLALATFLLLSLAQPAVGQSAPACDRRSPDPGCTRIDV